MKNKYGLPEDRLEEIRLRDDLCIYCNKSMTSPKNGGFSGNWATIEHLNHLPPWDNPDTVAMCCKSCNSSRGAKLITDWFETDYCIAKNINTNTVSSVVVDYIRKHESKYIKDRKNS